MSRESQQKKAERTAAIIQALRKTYPDAHCELNYSNPLELLIATILSAQTTDKQVNIVTRDLFNKYRTAEDYAKADLAELENDLKRIGLFRSKAKNIKACCETLVTKHRGEVPRSMEDLVSLGGVGRKTANVVLGNAFGINHGIVVDTHMARLADRLGLSGHEQPQKIEDDLKKLVPKVDWTMFSHWIIWHGRRRCFARGPQCEQCEIGALCPSKNKEEKR